MIKFENQKSFEQYLITSKLKHSIFIIIVNNEKESQAIIAKVKETLPVTYERVSWQGGKHSFENIVSSLDTLSLFAEGEIVEIQGMENFSPSQIEVFSLLLSKKRKNTFFILTAGKNLFFSIEGACLLDLSLEKPWDHKKRVMGFGFDVLRKEEKTIKYPLMEKLVDFAGGDLATVLQYIELLICYTGGRKEIENEDFAILPMVRKKQKSWQLADFLIFGEGNSLIVEEMNDAEFYALITGLRGRIQMGIKIKEGIKVEDVPESLVSRYIEYCSSLPKSYFIEALSLTYKIEVLSRGGEKVGAHLFDLLYVKLKELRERGAHGIAYSPA